MTTTLLPIEQMQTAFARGDVDSATGPLALLRVTEHGQLEVACDRLWFAEVRPETVPVNSFTTRAVSVLHYSRSADNQQPMRVIRASDWGQVDLAFYHGDIIHFTILVSDLALFAAA
jgi:hypothetical protein